MFVLFLFLSLQGYALLVGFHVSSFIFCGTGFLVGGGNRFHKNNFWPIFRFCLVVLLDMGPLLQTSPVILPVVRVEITLLFLTKTKLGLKSYLLKD